VGQRRLAAPRGPRHEHRLALRRHGDGPIVVGAPKRDPVPPQARLEAGQVVREKLVDQLADAGPGAPRRHEVGLLPQRGERVGDGDGALAGLQEGVVVLGVSDPDGIVRRQPQLPERGRQTRPLVHSGGEHHDRAFVEDDLQLQAELADRFDGGGLVRRDGGDEDAPGRQRGDPAAAKQVEERGGGRRPQRPALARSGGVEERAVLRHDPVEEVEPVAHRLQLLQLAPGHEQELPPRRAKPLQ